MHGRGKTQKKTWEEYGKAVTVREVPMLWMPLCASGSFGEYLLTRGNFPLVFILANVIPHTGYAREHKFTV